MINHNMKEMENNILKFISRNNHIKNAPKAANFFKSIKKENFSEKLILKIINENPAMAQFLPQEVYTKKASIELIRKSSFSDELEMIPKKFQTAAFYKELVKAEPECVNKVPAEFLTNSLCMMALKEKPWLIKYMNQTPKLCLYALKHGKGVYDFIEICENDSREETIENLKEMLRLEKNKSLLISKINSL